VSDLVLDLLVVMMVVVMMVVVMMVVVMMVVVMMVVVMMVVVMMVVVISACECQMIYENGSRCKQQYYCCDCYGTDGHSCF
jgi:hypothetical protein